MVLLKCDISLDNRQGAVRIAVNRYKKIPLIGILIDVVSHVEVP